MTVTTDNDRPPCPGGLLITPADRVLCALPAGHRPMSLPGGADNTAPTYHQGVWDGRVYVWDEHDAGVIRTLRNAGFHTQCDHHAVKLAVVVTPESGPIAYEVTP